MIAETASEQNCTSIGFTFTETMKGYIASGEMDYGKAERVGRKLGERLRFRVAITIDDLDTFMATATHEARLTGTIEAKRFGGAVQLDAGRFNLFVVDGSGRNQMRYTMTFSDLSGQGYRLDGFKDIHNDREFDLWMDTTTLFVRIFRLDGLAEPIVGTGILHIRAIDLLPQVRSMRALNARNPAEAASAHARFGRFFFGHLWDEYHSSLRPSLRIGRHKSGTSEPNRDEPAGIASRLSGG